ncbi:hypothetical protein SAMN05444157_1175 [Frankineae bacterium MT45]|nr:hypothetical protein SAMN05444157_1175 [Frankineae bacterium MT45]
MTQPPSIRPRDRVELAGALILIAAGGGALSYWLIGDQSFPGGEDHFFGPYQVNVTLLRVLGVVATLGFVYGLVTVVRRQRQRAYSVAWIVAALALIAAGAATGFFWRVATATVVGANIGAGLLFTFAAFMWFIAAVALMVAIGLQYQLSHSQPPAQH